MSEPLCSASGRSLLLVAVVLVVCSVLMPQCRAGELTCYCNIGTKCLQDNFTCTIPDAERPHPHVEGYRGGCVAFHTITALSNGGVLDRLEYGCFHGDSLFTCFITNFTNSRCCSIADGQLCNRHFNVSPPAGPVTTVAVTRTFTTVVHIHHGSTTSLEIAVPLAILLAVCLACMAAFVVFRLRNGMLLSQDGGGKAQAKNGSRPGGERSEDSGSGEYTIHKQVQPRAFNPKPPLNGDSVGSEYSSIGSGSGKSHTAYLVRRTMAREVDLRELIGKGRYGEVHCGIWQGEDVAIKIFYARDESSWLQETQIYNSGLIHENILSWYGSDVLSRDDRTELWLITQFHPLGSLYDYLLYNELDVETTLNFVYSMASGLNHLHTEIVGTSGKRSIAHRDLKAKNILVKNDLTCCIADLGLAVLHDPESEEPPDVPTHKVGTKRYMSPEMLLEEMNVFKFHAFRCADIYSLGLVLWETIRRCRVDGQVCEYSIPYHDRLPHDPDFHEVRAVVVDDKYRPPVPEHVRRDPDTAPLVRLMADSWRMDPLARVTALRIKKTLYEIRHRRRARRLPAVAEEGRADQRNGNPGPDPNGNPGPIVQPHAVALPPPRANANSSLDATYSARGPEADQQPDGSGHGNSWSMERSESLFLAPNAKQLQQQQQAARAVSVSSRQARLALPAHLARQQQQQQQHSSGYGGARADSYGMSESDMSASEHGYPSSRKGDHGYPSSRKGGEVSMCSMSLSLENVKSPTALASSLPGNRGQRSPQTSSRAPPVAAGNRQHARYQESTMSAESSTSNGYAKHSPVKQPARSSTTTVVTLEYSGPSKIGEPWTEASC